MIVTYETFEHHTGTEEVAIITHADGSYTSMPKAVYEAQQKHLTENPTEDVE